MSQILYVLNQYVRLITGYCFKTRDTDDEILLNFGTETEWCFQSLSYLKRTCFYIFIQPDNPLRSRSLQLMRQEENNTQHNEYDII